MATKTYSMTMDEDLHDDVEKLSLAWNKEIGKNRINVSGYLSYLVVKAKKEAGI